jgi:hypothetical protein
VTAYSDSGNKAYTYQHMLTWEWDTDPENAVVVDGDADAGAIYTSPYTPIQRRIIRNIQHK